MLICDGTEGAGKASMLKSVFIFKLIIWLVCDAQMRIQLVLTTEGQFFSVLPSLLSGIADCSKMWFSEYEVKIYITNVFFNFCTPRSVRFHWFVISEVDISIRSSNVSTWEQRKYI